MRLSAPSFHLAPSVIVMGVAGSGKTSVTSALAERLARPWLDGDSFHTPENRLKMAAGQALNDADRSAWLALLASELRNGPSGLLMACSALRRRYREQLREASPALRFVFLDLPLAVAQARVSARSDHFFPPHLVNSQFAALERPVDEPNTKTFDAEQPLPSLLASVETWLRTS